jgi:hypothetical protein
MSVNFFPPKRIFDTWLILHGNFRIRKLGVRMVDFIRVWSCQVRVADPGEVE